MQWRFQNGLPYLVFPQLDALQGFFHAVLLRYRLNADGERRSLEMGLNGSVPDDAVWRNRRQISKTFGSRQMVFARQVHGTTICCWHKSEDRSFEGDYQAETCDGLVTNSAGQALFIQVADCQPVLCVDPVEKVVANIHSGWRGSVRNIIGTAIEAMKSTYGCRAENIVCGIGPSLGPCCAEFINYKDEMPSKFWKYRRTGDRFDFWQVSTDQMTAAGILPENIAVSAMCTRCNPHLFFSYRGERQTGRFAAVIGINNG